jgi:hypothetical protein
MEQRSLYKRDSHSTQSSMGSGYDGHSDSFESSSTGRGSSSSETSKTSRTYQGNSIVISSPEMIPAIAPAVPSPPRYSPLLTPMISLQPERLVTLGGTTQASLVAIPVETIVNPRAYANDGGPPNTATTSAVGDYFTVRARSGTIHSVGTPGVLKISLLLLPRELRKRMRSYHKRPTHLVEVLWAD